MKKVLIITYYWPPSGGGGVQRWLNFARNLPAYGWEPVIFTPEDPDFHIRDESLVKEGDESIEVIRFPIWEPTQLLNKKGAVKQGQLRDPKKKSWKTELLIWIRGNFFFPDQRKFWIKPSVNFLKDLLERNEIKAIITSGPPHSMHLIGRNLKRKTGIPWIADFRDPWSEWDLLKEMKLSSLSWNIHKKMERSVLEEADTVIAASPSWAEDFHQMGAERTISITNGFEDQDFVSGDLKMSGKFQIGHYGMINELREPTLLFSVLKKLYQQHEGIRRDLELVFAGIIEPSFEKRISEDPGLKEFVKIKSYIPHEQLLKEYQDNYALLLIQNQSAMAKGHIPGKFFEYLASGRTILFQGDPQSDVGKMITETESGHTYTTENEADLEKIILSLYEDFKDGKTNNLKDQHLRFSRKELTKKLAELLDNTTSL